MKLAALAVLFGLIGASIGDEEGFLPGIMFGLLVGVVQGLRGRVAKLEGAEKKAWSELIQLREELARVRAAAEQAEQRAARHAAAEPVVQAAAAVAAVAAAPASQVEQQEAQEEAIASEPVQPQLFQDPEPTRAPEDGPVRIDIAAQPTASALDERGAPIWNTAPQSDGSVPASPDLAARTVAYEGQSGGSAAGGGGGDLPFDRFERWLRELLFGGNTIVRVGILVLLVGVVLLLRYAAEHAVFPIELRMAAAALIAIALVGVGYRQREARPGFGRTLQGGGIAALYLVVFFSFRTYELLPSGLAFGLLVCIALSSGVLAVLQDALALIVIGQIGGFMAPVLASSGGGSHVALFSYYLLLNLLVFAVAWFKPWRALNLIGFAFTFGIGSTWGALRYRPEDFASTEPFLIAFFLLYSLIPVLYALKRKTSPAPDARLGGRATGGGWVDASLVFGTPLAVLLLQYAMVKDVRFGMAFSALGLAAFYVLISRMLYVRAPEALRGLIESFLAIGIGFATLAVPYGFDNHDFTGATWALEGAGLYWVGTRQQRWLSRAAGVVLQLMAAGALVVQLDRTELASLGQAAELAHAAAQGWPLANARFLASVLVCLGSLFVAFWAHKQRARLPEFEATGLQLLIVLGLTFYLRAALGEVTRVADPWLQPGLRLAVAVASLFALSLVGRRLAWLPARLPAVALALLGPLFLWGWESEHGVQPLARAGWLAFPLLLVMHTELLRSFTAELPGAKAPLHTVYVWSWTLLLALCAYHWVDMAELGASWIASAVALVLAIALSVTVWGVRRQRWPFSQALETHLDWSAGALALCALLWTLWANLELTGDATPLPSWPLLNPLDLAQLGLFAAAGYWYVALPADKRDEGMRSSVPALCGGLAFYWFNALLARSVHHFAGVPFNAEALWDATPMQVSLSVSWSLLGLIGTVLGSKRRVRGVWVIGASLLGVVVAKLFLVDLAQLSTIAKIGTFLVVGLLLVLVGYFAPVPPAGRADEERAA